MKYPIAIEPGDKDTAFGVVVPDLPGCFSAGDDLEEAMRMMEEIDTMTERLPGLDCGSCGAPSCRALAEDVVKKLARPTDCIFILREQVQHVATTLSSIGSPFEEKEEKE